MKDINSFETACQKVGVDATVLPEVSMLPEKHRKSIIAYYKLIIIAQAINDGWEPNWNNSSEYKYYPWLYVKASDEKPSGSGLSYDDCGYVTSFTTVGSRLVFKSREAARFFGETFTDLLTDYLLIA